MSTGRSGSGLGADGYVTKPFSWRELAARIRAVLGRHGKPKNCRRQRLGWPCLRDIEEVCRRHPDLDVFAGQDLRAEPSPSRDPFAPAASAPTAAELRLLPMLAALYRS